MVFGGNVVLLRGIDMRPMHLFFPSASVRTERWRGDFLLPILGKGWGMSDASPLTLAYVALAVSIVVLIFNVAVFVIVLTIHLNKATTSEPAASSVEAPATISAAHAIFVARSLDASCFRNNLFCFFRMSIVYLPLGSETCGGESIRFAERWNSSIESQKIIDQKSHEPEASHSLPDILTILQRETFLTRHTLFEILKQSNRIKEFLINPQAFITETTKCIKKAVEAMIVKGIKYEKIEGQQYEMRLFEDKEIEAYLSQLYEVHNQDKTPYDYVRYDFGKEKEVAEHLDTNESVRFFCKLPQWFMVPTPVGMYNPDWAIVMENDGKLYLVRETKGTLDQDKRRKQENDKVHCGRAHFAALGVDYEVAVEIADVIR